MHAPESLAFESYKSKLILFFAYLICPSVSVVKGLKSSLRFAIFNFREKVESIFEIVLRTVPTFVSAHTFCASRKPLV